MAKVELKQPIVEEIANNIKDAQAVVLVDYSGLTVEQDTILRKELRESGVQYKVYKNTLMRRAFEGTPCADLDKHLHGTNAIAISATTPAAADTPNSSSQAFTKSFNSNTDNSLLLR